MKIFFVCFFLMVLAGCAATTNHQTSGGFQPADYHQKLLHQAQIAYQSEDFTTAMLLMEQVVANDPSAERWLQLGSVAHKAGNASRAQLAFAEALKLKPDWPAAYEQIGLLYFDHGMHEPAVQNLEHAVSLDGSLHRAWNALGIIADLGARFEDAEHAYQKAIQASPDSAYLRNNAGYSAYLSGHYERAEQLFRESLVLDPDYALALQNIGLVNARQGDYEQAIRVLADHQPLPRVYNDVGFIAMKNNDLDIARTLLERARDLSPRFNEAAHKNLMLLSRMEAGEMVTPDHTPETIRRADIMPAAPIAPELAWELSKLNQQCASRGTITSRLCSVCDGSEQELTCKRNVLLTSAKIRGG